MHDDQSAAVANITFEPLLQRCRPAFIWRVAIEDDGSVVGEGRVETAEVPIGRWGCAQRSSESSATTLKLLARKDVSAPMGGSRQHREELVAGAGFEPATFGL